jgi:GPH family glycoside/pentoside/hexuronide:cation symporter
VVPGLLSLAAFATLRWYKLDDSTMKSINLAKQTIS